VAVVTLPSYGIRLSWTRHDVLTIITLPDTGLPVSYPLAQQPPPIPLSIRIRRQDLIPDSRISRTFDDISELALKSLEALSWLCKPKVAAKGEQLIAHEDAYLFQFPFRDNCVEVCVQERDVEVLRKSLLDPENRKRIFDYLHLGVFLPASICAAPAEGRTRLSRGRPPQGHLLHAILPEAFYFAHSLLRALAIDVENDGSPPSEEARVAQQNLTRVRRRVRAILLENDDTRTYAGPSTPDDPIYLIERAFRGAWKHCGMTPPSEGGVPQDYLKRYLYGRHRRALEAHLGTAWLYVDPGLPLAYTQFWITRLLGPPGSAAQAFGLLPPLDIHPKSKR